jgi:large subunit ribosomal protein L34
MKRTFQPNRSKQRKTSGFLVRMSSAGGKNVIRRRRAKGRKVLTVS